MPPENAAFTGRSDASRSFRAQLERVAEADATVLITGEGGSGKTTAARALHALGRRRDGPLVVVGLAAVSTGLVESELFGHERGAFTGAHDDRAGCFRRAEGGTLVLDDVSLLALEVQVKLLRVLQERVVEPLGAEEAVPIDVRVVATSTPDLATEAAAGRFREDLFYRLAVVPLVVPPLRTRGGDLDALAEELGSASAARLGVPPRSFSPEALERLAAHPWPGNVRELENAIERVLALGARDCAPIEADEFAFLGVTLDGAARRVATEALAQGLSWEELELALFEQALAEQRGNLSAAARQLGITRRALEYRVGRGTAAATGGALDPDAEAAT